MGVIGLSCRVTMSCYEEQLYPAYIGYILTYSIYSYLSTLLQNEIKEKQLNATQQLTPITPIPFGPQQPQLQPSSIVTQRNSMQLTTASVMTQFSDWAEAYKHHRRVNTEAGRGGTEDLYYRMPPEMPPVDKLSQDERLYEDTTWIRLQQAYRAKYQEARTMLEHRMPRLQALAHLVPSLFDVQTELGRENRELVFQMVDSGNLEGLLEFVNEHYDEYIEAQAKLRASLLKSPVSPSKVKGGLR
jgi:hypothetical protein